MTVLLETMKVHEGVGYVMFTFDLKNGIFHMHLVYSFLAIKRLINKFSFAIRMF
jgi:hypothetical protein